MTTHAHVGHAANRNPDNAISALYRKCACEGPAWAAHTGPERESSVASLVDESPSTDATIELRPAHDYSHVPANVLQRKCACGGSDDSPDECEECSRNDQFGPQAKLKISQPGDAYEQEADRLADQVLTTPSPRSASGAPPQIQRLSERPNQRETAVPTGVDRVLASPGRPLGRSLREDMEQRFGQDFSRVRVHYDATAARSARTVNAHAYTVGYDIAFGAGCFAPTTSEGRRLLAHELTHVVQQTQHGAASIQRKEAGSQHAFKTITQITVAAYTTGRATAVTTDGQTIAIIVKVNDLDVGRQQQTKVSGEPNPKAWSEIHVKRGDTDCFVYQLPPGIAEADPMTVVVTPGPRTARAKAEIRSLQPHVREFLIARGKEPSEQELESIASAGRILEEAGVTEEELLLQRQRRTDWQAIGKKEGEATDLEAWARGYVAHRQQTILGVKAGAAALLTLAKRFADVPPDIGRWIRQTGILNILEEDNDRILTAYDESLRRLTGSYLPDEFDAFQRSFATFEDLRTTMRAFEEALVSQIRARAEMVLDNTEAVLLRTDARFKGMWKPTQAGPGFLWTELEKIRQNADVQKVQQQHKSDVRTIEREEEAERERIKFLDPRSQGRDEYEKRKEKREDQLRQLEQQYKEELLETVAKVSNVKLSPGSDLPGMISAQTPDQAQQRLVEALAKGRVHVKNARSKLDNRKFLYAADKIIDAEKKDLDEALGTRPGAWMVGDIIDRLVKERRAEKSLWDDIWRILEIVAAFIPGVPGWIIRLGIAAKNFDEKMESIGDQADLYSVRASAVPADPNAASSALLQAGIEALPDIPGSSAVKAKRATQALETTAKRSTAAEAARLAERRALGSGTTAAREGEQAAVKATEDVAREQRLAPTAAREGEQAVPKTAAREGEQAVPKTAAEAAEAKPAVTGSTAEARVLEAGRGVETPSLEQIDAELAIVERSKTRPSPAKGYQEEVELANGHTWRRDADGNWCRYSKDPLCVTRGRSKKTRVSDRVVRTEQDIDEVVTASQPRLDRPPPSVKKAEDVRMWELYNDYYEERIASMRADLRSEVGATKREMPLSFDAFKQRYTKNPELIKALRGRLSQGETGNIIADITSGKVAGNLGISSVPNPAVGEVVYPDFVFKRSAGDGFSAVSQKRRGFAAMTEGEVRKTVMADIREGVEKYYGNKYVRRRGLDETGELIRIDELVLNYDIRAVPESMRPQIQKIAEAYEGVDVKIGFFQMEPTALELTP
jgi:hypothetical protein